MGIVAVIVGVVGAAWVLESAIRTVVIPRPERVWLTTAAFDLARRLSRRIVDRVDSPSRRHRILGAFAPTVLISLPLLWSVGLIAAFSAIYWGLDAGSVSESISLSGSSLTTLGFVGAPTLTIRLVAIAQALIGLAIVALMISFLPTIYSTFSRREVSVGRLTTRAGDPPNPVEFVSRLDTIGRLDLIGERWAEWEDWFVELGETHTTFPALVYFRSARPGRSWVTAAEAALDTAALVTAMGLVPPTGQADTMIRSGYLALQSVAEFYRIPAGATSTDTALEELTISRADFDRLLDALVANGVRLDVDRDTGWEAFSGWRVNYDHAISGLADLVYDVPTHWTQY